MRKPRTILDRATMSMRCSSSLPNAPTFQLSVLILLIVLSPSLLLADRFRTVVLSEAFHSEGAAIADLDDDGTADIISGAFWYKGPNFQTRYTYASAKEYAIAGDSEYFFTFTRDFDNDGDIDILSIPIPGGAAQLHLNPGQSKISKDLNWPSHQILSDVGNESPTLVDFDGDGSSMDLVCIQGGQFGYAKPASDVTQRWQFITIGQRTGLGRFTHGLGVGDIDGDGKMDLLEKDGWWRQPAKENEPFQFYPVKFAESGGAQMFAYDFDGDGDNDIVSSQNAHGYGLCWFERRGKDLNDCLFVKHQIIGSKPSGNPYGLSISQLHALALTDIDGDGIKDIVTGKRFWAHGGKDPGAQQLPVLYWFKTGRSRLGVEFIPMQIHDRIGVGTQLVTGDVDNNGHVDIVVGNKLGTFLLLNNGTEEPQPQRSGRPTSIVGTADFAGGVRFTEPLSPAEEQASFVLPPGFEAQLFASEPQIAKPLNMAFDHRGRLWVTNTVEYPYPAPIGEKGRDSIKILEDTTGDGRADKVTTFADGLNIPMGLYPYADGVICFSIPNILFLRDTDGDGVADERKVLYGPFDTTRDTHGMCNAFTRGYDGWLYACHGFNNQSQVSGADGHAVTMHSGNTFRMKLDGSRIEHFTHGQVNPFGMAIDPHGDIFTADCHTKPVSLLIAGGFHESFGKPHDGLGFTPPLMQHLHGSTAIGGIALYHAESFPMEYQGSAFGGNVMTGRVNRNSIQQQGGSLVAQEEPDFLISGDPWFRPVDLQVGPDGALYVADFYNKIIGHYEVPLDHPGRDRHRGRIWRIVYKGERVKTDPHSNAPLQLGTSLKAATASLGSDNLTERMLATDAIVDRHVKESNIDNLHHSLSNASSSNEKVHLLWALARLGELKAEELERCLRDTDARVRGHGFQVLATFPERTPQTDDWIATGLQDANLRVRRYAAGAAAKLCSEELITPILSGLVERKSDPHLCYALRIALKNHLENEAWFKTLATQLSRRQRADVLEICLALKTNYAGQFIAANLDLVRDSSPEKLSDYLTFASRFASSENLNAIIALSRDCFESDIPKQEELLRSISSGLSQRGLEPTERLGQWAEVLARKYLNIGAKENTINLDRASIPWSYVAFGEVTNPSDTWQLSKNRNSADGELSSLLHSSFPAGEQRVGTYRSGAFALSMPFSFYIAGHDGFPDKPMQGKNYVRLCDAATHLELASWPAPRNDVAQRVEWRESQLEGRRVYVELVDGDSANAYAWLAVGRFSEEGLNPSTAASQYLRAARLVRDLKIRDLAPVMMLLISNPQATNEDASQFAKAYAAVQSGPYATALAEAISFSGTDAELRSALIKLLEDREHESDSFRIALSQSMRVATAAEQRRLALELSRNQTGIASLLELVEAGSASTSLLLDPIVATRFETLGSELEINQVHNLTNGLTSEAPNVTGAIEKHRKAYMNSAGEVSRGTAVFSKNCANCHRVAGKGSEVGPNLDGIGNRGLDRLLEDVLLPNRNIDAAFRSTSILTEDGNVLSGLVKRIVGKQLVLVDQTGKERTIATDEIASKKTVRLSPMPSNFHEVLTDDQCRDLLAYLLSLTN